MAEAEALLAQGRSEPQGTLRVSATTALGRRWVGPVAAAFATRHPGVTVSLELTDHVVDVVEAGIDCAVRVGAVADSRLVARRLADSRRVVCATPGYLRRHGRPRRPEDLQRHACIVLAAGSHAHDTTWTFQGPDGAFEQPVRGRLVTNNGQQAYDWMQAGHGLARRSLWDVAHDLADGRLVEVLRDWSQVEAPISVVYASRRLQPAKTRLFIQALVDHFASSGAGLAGP